VLGVGDQEFFAKCMARIEEFRRAGKTIIFVSHSLPVILSLCNRVIWLDHGRIVMDGEAAAVVDAYSANVSAQPAQSAGHAG
jgi:ABC-type polysaccharide/polyol phosphate transport system ATPase subunit